MSTSNTEILIKRSLANNKPSFLHEGELAYSYASNTLFIGTPDSNSAIEIGHYSDLSNLTSGSYGSQTSIPVITVDGHGTVTNVYTQTISTTLDFNDSHGGTGSVNLLDGSFEFIGANGIVTTASANTLTIDVDNTIVRSNTAGGNQTIDGILNVSGDLNVTGNITYTDVATIVSQNSLIKLANNNIYSDVVDIGFYGQSNNGTVITYTGLFRHAGDAGKDYYLFDNYTGTDPDANNFVINPNDPSIKISTLHANVIGGLIQGGGFLASEGIPTSVGGTGYSFQNDGGYDTGMFSTGDGILEFYNNNVNTFSATQSSFTHYTPITFDAGGATLHDTSNHSLLFGTGVQDTGSSQRVTIGYQPDTQTGQSWDAIAIGSRAGTTNQRDNAIAIGNRAGYTGQGESAVAIGGGDGGNGGAGQIDQGYSAVAIGNHAAYNTQGSESVAIGYYAAQTNQQQNSVAIGSYAGNSNQGQFAVAVGHQAGEGGSSAQGNYSVAVGAYAGQDHQVQNSIILNASGSTLNADNAGLYIDPIRNDVAGGNVTAYNTSTKELVNTNVVVNNNGITLANGTNITDGVSGLFVDSLNAAETSNIVYYNTTTKELTYGTMADLRPDAISNNGHIWAVTDTGSLQYNDTEAVIGSNNAQILIDLWSTMVAPGYPNNPIRITNAIAGHDIYIASEGNARSALRWHSSTSNTYTQFDTESTGAYIKAADWTGSAGVSTWQFDYAGNITLPGGSTLSDKNGALVFGTGITGETSGGLYVNPVRYTATQDATYDGLMFYNESTKEIRYSYTLDGGTF